MPFDPASYGDTIARLFSAERLPELGPGRPDAAQRARLAELSPETLFAPACVHDRSMAECCLAGLWLHFDFLDESHQRSQEIETREGSYWHAIMHRREPDYANSKYWFRRVGKHPIGEPLAHEAGKLARESSVAAPTWLTRADAWDAFGFVDLCEQHAHLDSPCHRLCQEIQLAEWKLLFDYCAARAIGAR